MFKFRGDSYICLAGSAVNATLDGEAIKMFVPIKVGKDQVLKIGAIKDQTV